VHSCNNLAKCVNYRGRDLFICLMKYFPYSKKRYDNFVSELDKHWKVHSANLWLISNYYWAPTKSNNCDVSFMLTLKTQTIHYQLIFIRKNKLQNTFIFNEIQLIFQITNLLVQEKKIGMWNCHEPWVIGPELKRDGVADDGSHTPRARIWY
jgi:hypothetical protein